MSSTDRKPVSEMSEREISEETLTLLRAFADVLQAVGSHPMAGMMMPALNSMQA